MTCGSLKPRSGLSGARNPRRVCGGLLSLIVSRMLRGVSLTMANEKHIAEITSISALLETTANRYFSEPRGRWIFRGHADANHKLIPAVGRGTYSAKSRSRHERSL